MRRFFARCPAKSAGTAPNPADVEDGLDQAGNFHFNSFFSRWRPFADVRINPSIIEVFALYACARCGRTREVCSPGVAHWEDATSDRRLITDHLLKSLRSAPKSTRSDIWIAASQDSACAPDREDRDPQRRGKAGTFTFQV